MDYRTIPGLNAHSKRPVRIKSEELYSWQLQNQRYEHRSLPRLQESQAATVYFSNNSSRQAENVAVLVVELPIRIYHLHHPSEQKIKSLFLRQTHY